MANSTTNIKAKDVEEYIASFPKDVQKILKEVRETIKAAAPQAEESISYGIPGYKFDGPVAYFAGYKNHIGFYATPNGHEAFRDELTGYRQGKGSVQFPIGEPMPLKLISRVVKYNLKHNIEKAKVKRKK
jgi:uncharacterized protein YdhG (YjbR/CyaY superfamily)